MLHRLVRRAVWPVYICRAAQIRYARLIALYCTRSVRSYDEVLSADRVCRVCAEYAQSIRLRLHMIRCESVCARVTVYVSVG